MSEKKYNCPEDMEKVINAYFAECDRIEYAIGDDGKVIRNKNGEKVMDKKPTPPTSAGMVLALGFNSRTSLNDYCFKNGNEELQKEYSNVLTRARLRLESYYETRLSDKDGCTGAKFWLPNQADGWNDKVTINGTINVTLLDDPDDSDDE
jgi:hypothetical protein